MGSQLRTLAKSNNIGKKKVKTKLRLGAKRKGKSLRMPED